ncbi:cyclic nucleotide-gated ion channel 1-like isoform X2 [Malania oleifera]|uniref:cyclic nucleotide-gated ion channel 1-like isoform X1 n=1 Tax=Malania oleifera TaxID=397392 RepID=UPI0025AEB40A|nr:cyclic nucleotide-gated ion channel 1-like isoform X1 [Malania oleifera]XP_057980517.1 cyclic nucleotide-gated ion channel 1-like isoform X1 [Malania oleifera]XP_057980518.1 cyclic nucleotide-gated ion channel 1-like isoform X1 [Malania oleifera]XP_057980519.1 cyclic nucleotide-gated ion channel 1-like isoform X1 [Malania oleifera]XP_057980521.1 cyclic nucleotide-gated ion channel 1-like isoform X2 [Malania oleifera]
MDKSVRFQDNNSERSLGSEQQYSTENGFSPRIGRPTGRSVVRSIWIGFERCFERIKSLRKPSRLDCLSDQLEKELVPRKKILESLSDRPGKVLTLRKKILDPQGRFLESWNKIFVFLCVIAVSLDPLFFYIPVIDHEQQCLSSDKALKITACVLRSFTDIFYILHIIFQFHTGFIAPPSRVFGRGELIEDPLAIAKRYLFSYFIIDILSILPLPQVVLLVIIPKLRGPVPLATKDLLKFVVFSQYVPRIIRIGPLLKEVTRTAGMFTETAWAGAVFNLFLYMLASHIVGASWYLFSIERKDTCWREACKRPVCHHEYLYCGAKRPGDTSFLSVLNASCPLLEPENIKDRNVFNFGMFFEALHSRIIESEDFPKKFFFCFWWGLRNLSSLGQNIKTSTFVEEKIISIFICVFGLFLFASLIGNMQKHIQTNSVRVEEMRVKKQDAEKWMSHRSLPDHLRQRIRQHEQYKWQETRGVEEETLIRGLPKDLRRDIKRHLCLDLLMRVPMFEKMDERLLDALCHRLKPVLYTERSFILREGDPVDEMLFVMRGNLLTMTTDGGRTGFFNSVHLKAGDFCGEELLTWALDPHSSSNLPISTRTVEALTAVEAFALMADDLKFVASQYRRLHSKKLQHIFRFYSQQWRAWAACFIQAAWRRHCKRKHDNSFHEEEDWLQDALAEETGASPSLGATIFASRFAANALRTLRRKSVRSNRVPQRLLPLLPPKPAEPDFTSEENH